MNQEEVIKFWKMLGHQKQTELRAIIPQVETHSHHFSTEEELLSLCKRYEGTHNLYLGVNERNLNGTKAEEVIALQDIPIDIDCINKPATDEDIVEANTVCMTIIQDAISQGFKKPFVTFSGNGYQIHFRIPSLTLDKKNYQDIEAKVKEFEKRLIEKYSNAKVKLDQVGDLPRIMRIAGTFNIKSKTSSYIINDSWEEDPLLKDYLLSLDLTNKISVGGLSSELKEKIKNDEKVMEMMDGNLLGKQSRSEAELSLVCHLVQLGLDREQVFRVMASCKIGKWQEANVKYRELTYRKAIEIICQERLKNKINPSLSDLYLVYKKWLYLEDMKRIDIVLATYLTQYLSGTPIWLILVGNSGDGKTEQVMALKKCENFKMLVHLTSKTLVSGMKNSKDLAPELNGKVVVISDMAQILQLNPQDKAEVWAQLRDLYDGYAGKNTGSGKNVLYENLRVTLIACSTPKIDSQILVHQDLGTREIIYRTEDTLDEYCLMQMAMRNEDEEEKMKRELSEITYNFLKDKRVIKKELSPEEETELQNIALFIAKSRATAEYDSYTDELRNYVYPERPTRIVKQLKRIYLSLLSLEDGYSKERAFQILWHLAKSCAFPIRISVFEHFIREFLNFHTPKEITTSSLANKLLIGKRTAKRELSILWNMGIITKTEREEGNRWQPTDYWKLNLTNSFVESYLKFIKSSFNLVV